MILFLVAIVAIVTGLLVTRPDLSTIPVVLTLAHVTIGGRYAMFACEMEIRMVEDPPHTGHASLFPSQLYKPSRACLVGKLRAFRFSQSTDQLSLVDCAKYKILPTFLLPSSCNTSRTTFILPKHHQPHHRHSFCSSYLLTHQDISLKAGYSIICYLVRFLHSPLLSTSSVPDRKPGFFDEAELSHPTLHPPPQISPLFLPSQSSSTLPSIPLVLPNSHHSPVTH